METLAAVFRIGTLWLGLSAVIGLLGVMWLVGLVFALRGTTPEERPSIIAAYGRAFPWRARRSRGKRRPKQVESRRPDRSRASPVLLWSAEDDGRLALDGDAVRVAVGHDHPDRPHPRMDARHLDGTGPGPC